MRPLIVATSWTGTFTAEAIRCGHSPQLDYLALAERLHTEVLDYDHVPVPGWWQRVEAGLRLDVTEAVVAARRVRQHRYDSVLSLSERVGIPLAGLLHPGTRHIVLGHHLLSPAKLRALDRLLIAAHWNRILVPTRAETEALRQHLHVDPDRIQFLHFTPLDTDFYHPQPATQNEDFVLSLGLSHRDYPTLLRAMAELPEVPLEIRAGSAWVHGTARLNHTPVPPNVTVAGPLSFEALRERYWCCRFVVVPIDAHTTQWSAGNTSAVLAQALGKAVIATRTPGMCDYVRHGETGLLVPPGDPTALAQAIATLWRDPRQAGAMGARGAHFAAAAFDLRLWVEGLVGHLNAVGSGCGLQ
jgi:glycosyltransferase involved in cell wall biosynthesis